MGKFSKCKIESHSLNRTLNRSLDRRCDRWSTSMLGGARRPRQLNHLRVACRLLTQYLRLANRMAKAEPHLFGPHARRYFLDTLQLESYEREVETAVRNVYGPPAPGEPVRISTLWTDRYVIQPGKRKMFLKWFREQYPS